MMKSVLDSSSNATRKTRPDHQRSSLSSIQALLPLIPGTAISSRCARSQASQSQLYSTPRYSSTALQLQLLSPSPRFVPRRRCCWRLLYAGRPIHATKRRNTTSPHSRLILNLNPRPSHWQLSSTHICLNCFQTCSHSYNLSPNTPIALVETCFCLPTAKLSLVVANRASYLAILTEHHHSTTTTRSIHQSTCRTLRRRPHSAPALTQSSHGQLLHTSTLPTRTLLASQTSAH